MFDQQTHRQLETHLVKQLLKRGTSTHKDISYTRTHKTNAFTITELILIHEKRHISLCGKSHITKMTTYERYSLSLWSKRPRVWRVTTAVTLAPHAPEGVKTHIGRWRGDEDLQGWGSVAGPVERLNAPLIFTFNTSVVGSPSVRLALAARRCEGQENLTKAHCWRVHWPSSYS